MSAETYLTAWLVYLAGLIGFLCLGWYLSRSFPDWCRGPVRAMVAALLLMPWPVMTGDGELAPAWVVTLFDGLIQEGISAGRAGWPLLLVVVLAGLAAVAEYWRGRQGKQHE